jgi:hypothetical protein
MKIHFINCNFFFNLQGYFIKGVGGIVISPSFHVAFSRLGSEFYILIIK